MKAPLLGLIDRNGGVPAVNKFKDVLCALVIGASWASLQPSPGGALNTTALDAGIAKAQGLGLRVRLRITGGVDAPDWAKTLDGTPIAVNVDGTSGTVGRFWLPDYQAAWADLHERLAAVYDADTRVADIDVGGGCGLVACEPLLRGWGTTTPANLIAAGFTPALDDYCQHAEIDAFTFAWSQTRAYLALNPYQNLRVGPGGLDVFADEPYTEAIGIYARAALAERAVLGNDSIRTPLQAEPYRTMYAWIAQHGPFGYQTAVPNKIGDGPATLQWAVDQGATSVELPRDYPTYDHGFLATIHAALIANG